MFVAGGNNEYSMNFHNVFPLLHRYYVVLTLFTVPPRVGTRKEIAKREAGKCAPDKMPSRACSKSQGLLSSALLPCVLLRATPLRIPIV